MAAPHASADVLVVGAGVVGLSIALELQERGARVLVLERTGVAEGQSGIQPGGIRLQWGTTVNCLLATESLAWWQSAEERLQSPVPLAFASCGYLFVAHSTRALERLEANVRVQNAAGVPSRIVSPAEAGDLVPGLRTAAIVGGSWCADDGYLGKPQAAIAAMARLVDIRIARVDTVAPLDGGWALATSAGRFTAPAVAIAAGVDSRSLVAPLGVDLPIELEPRHLFLSAAIRERLLEPLVVSPERRFAAKQLHAGRVLASDLGATGDPESDAPAWRRNVRAVISELLPMLEYVDLDVIASGAYDVTPDRQPILGPLDGHDGLHVAAGFSGHGFMIAPAVGRMIAAAVAGERDTVLDILDSRRFREGRTVPEPQVI
ncbi:MAG TPA: FAD-binding oxidoreductase [Gaiella sp.]|jgi:sarcosine oxidase subunit beta|nr:FAD-binding oxidoreductase [Gaiella sp.]